MTKTNLQQQVTVRALPSKVWKVLTNAEYVNQYLFKDSVHCDWIEGSAIITDPDNTPVKLGKVLEAVPGMLLKFSCREQNSPIFITTTHELIVASDGVELKMRSEGFKATDTEFLIRLQQANLLLQKIKWLSEYS